MFKIPKRILDTLGIEANGKSRKKNVIVDYKTENEGGGHLTYQSKSPSSKSKQRNNYNNNNPCD